MVYLWHFYFYAKVLFRTTQVVSLENQVKMENFMKRNYRLFLCILLSMPVLLLSGCDLPSRLNFGKTSGSGESISKSGFILIPSLPSPYMEQKTKPCSMTVFLWQTLMKIIFPTRSQTAMCQKSMQQAVHLSPCMKRPQN